MSNPGHRARKLTNDEVTILQQDNNLVSEYKQNKLEEEAKKNWDLFYKRNERNFFKDRHWTTREFQELSNDHLPDSKDVDFPSRPVLLEVGCGVGNFIFPLIASKTQFFIYACDFSSRAVDFVKGHELYSTSVCSAFQCDITADDMTCHLADSSIDIVSLVFVLSAIHPSKMEAAIRNIRKVLKPKGVILFRDYGLYDQAMLRFSSGHKLAENFYVRQDGTRAFYFSEEYVAQLMTTCGFEILENAYVQRETVNKKESLQVPRIFVQGRFRRAT